MRAGMIAITAVALLVPPAPARERTVALAPLERQDAGARAGDGTGGNLTEPRITIRVEGAVRAGEYATIVVTEENLGGDGETAFDYGVGGGGHGVARSDTGCGGYRRGARDTYELRRAYRYPGTWPVTVTFTPSCGGRWGVPVVGRAEVRVTEGTVTSNGPEQPSFGNGGPHAWIAEGAPPLAVTVAADYQDPDGYLTQIRYRWGDGSPDTVYAFPLARCVDPPATWPSSSAAEDDIGYSEVVHAYPAAKRYRAVVEATFAGCDGRDVQTVRGDALVRLDDPRWR